MFVFLYSPVGKAHHVCFFFFFFLRFLSSSAFPLLVSLRAVGGRAFFAHLPHKLKDAGDIQRLKLQLCWCSADFVGWGGNIRIILNPIAKSRLKGFCSCWC